jgi:hypothetical protein
MLTTSKITQDKKQETIDTGSEGENTTFTNECMKITPDKLASAGTLLPITVTSLLGAGARALPSPEGNRSERIEIK